MADGRSWLTKALVNINIIVDFFLDPCDAPISVYLETLFPAVMDMLVDMFAFDVSEYQEQRPFSSFKPQDNKGKSKVRRGRKGGGHTKWNRIFSAVSGDPGELLGKRMAKHHGGSRRLLTGGRSHLWLIGGAMQRGAFWVWFASRLTGLFYDWYMGIIGKGYCSEPGAGIILAAEGADSAHNLFGWKPLVVWNILKQRGAPNWEVVFGTSGAHPLATSVRLDIWLNNDDTPSTFMYRVFTDGPAGEELQTEGEESLVYPDKKNVNFSFTVPPWSNFTIEVYSTQGLINLSDIYIHGISRGTYVFSPVQPWPRDFRGNRLTGDLND